MTHESISDKKDRRISWQMPPSNSLNAITYLLTLVSGFNNPERRSLKTGMDVAQKAVDQSSLLIRANQLSGEYADR